jgi:hypothetical protein
MTTDINMQHMTMTEYVAVAVLSEMINKDSTLQAIASKEMSAQQVVKHCFNVAEVFMEVRKERRLAET